MGCPTRSSIALPWWRSALLNLFNLCHWNDVPTMWKHNVIVLVFKTGDHSVPGNHRTDLFGVMLLQVLEHMVHSRIAPHISHRFQGGFRWGADMMAGALMDVLHMRSATHTFIAFVDIFKAFDTSWVEATMVELFSMGVQRRMWTLIAHCVYMARSRRSDVVPICQSLGRTQVLPRAECSRCSSTFLLMGSHGRCMLRARELMGSWDSCFAGQLHTDDLVVETSLDAVSAWGFRFRFTFGVGPSKSAAMIFGPRRNLPTCNVTLGGIALPVVSEF